jgi:hypothetical protein
LRMVMAVPLTAANNLQERVGEFMYSVDSLIQDEKSPCRT